MLARVRRAGQRTPGVVLAARDDQGSVVALLNAGAEQLFAEPFDLGELLARVEALIRRGKGQPSPVLTISDLRLIRSPARYSTVAWLLSLPSIPGARYLAPPAAGYHVEDELLDTSTTTTGKNSAMSSRFWFPVRRKLTIARRRTDPHTSRGRTTSYRTKMRRNSVRQRADGDGHSIASFCWPRVFLSRPGCRERLLSTLDAGMPARAMTMAALVRSRGRRQQQRVLDDTLMHNRSIPATRTCLRYSADRSGLITRSPIGPADPNSSGSSTQSLVVSLRPCSVPPRAADTPRFRCSTAEGEAFQPRAV